jgi:hypothetical protein
MSRGPIQAQTTSEPILVKPSNDIYTVLVAVATVASVGGLILFYMRMMDLFGGIINIAK